MSNTTFTKLRNGSWGVKGYGLRGGSVAYVCPTGGNCSSFGGRSCGPDCDGY